MSDFFVVPPKQEDWLPPIFGAAANLTPRALTWRTMLYNLLFAVYEIRLPKGWHLAPFRWILFSFGSVGVAYDDALGWVYGAYGVEKVDWQYMPVLFHVTLPNNNSGQPVQAVRGLNGAILHVHDNFTGYELLVDQYAQILAKCDEGVAITVDQATIGKLIGAKNQKDAKTLKTAIESTRNGDPIAFISNELFKDDGTLNMAAITADIGRAYIGDKLMETRLMIIKEFLTRVGVRTVGMEKREHLLDQEISENNDETGSEPYAVMTSLEEDLKLLNAMGCNISIKSRFDYSGAGIKEGGTENADKQDAGTDIGR